MSKPEATSTPTSVPHVSGRRAIRDQNSVQSPIDLDVSKHHYDTRSSRTSFRTSPEHSPKISPTLRNRSHVDRDTNRSGSHGLSESDQYTDSEEVPSDEFHPEPETSQDNVRTVSMGIGSVLCIALGIYLFAMWIDTTDKPASPSIQDKFSKLEKHFNKQQEDFWLQVRVAVYQIKTLERPGTIMFIYSQEAEKTLNKILDEVSKNALCFITECTNTVIEIQGSSLNTSEIVNNHGKIVSMYHEKLEKNGVMIVRNLEKVPGIAAQAFHSFCDEYNPIVKDALILFTLKVEKLPSNYPMKFVEDFLLKLWKDIGKDDKFYPLFTRITGTILTVNPE